MHTAAVGPNTRQMRAGIGGPGKKARGATCIPIAQQVKASGIPRSFAHMRAKKDTHILANKSRNGGSMQLLPGIKHDGR